MRPENDAVEAIVGDLNSDELYGEVVVILVKRLNSETCHSLKLEFMNAHCATLTRFTNTHVALMI